MQIRQEINLIDTSYTATNTNLAASEVSTYSSTNYNGTIAAYFEVVATNTNVSNSGSIILTKNGSTVTGGTLTIPASTTTPTLFRSGDISANLSDGYSYVMQIISGTATITCKVARLIIIQNATTLTNTETQIEIGNASSTTTTTDTALTNPKYWQYIAANWDGTLTAYFESTFQTGTSKSAATMTLQESSSITAPSWSNVASSAVTTTSTTAARVRSGAITLTDGNWYRAVMKAGNSKSGITTYNAKVIVQQVTTETTIDSFTDVSGPSDGLVVGTAAQLGQSITGSGQALHRAKFYLKKFGSPTADMTAVLYAITGTHGTNATPTGSVLATSATIASSSLTSSYAWVTFTFTTPYTLANGANYALGIQCDGDSGNHVRGGIEDATSHGGNRWTYDGSSYSSFSTFDVIFQAIYLPGITKLEPQYLLANTLFAAGTGLQTFLTKWDSTEWSGVTNTYTFQAEAADNSTSDVELWAADGSGSAIATVTNVDNAGTGAATMP